MQLVLSEDQELIAKTAADFVAEKSPIARMRALRDSGDPAGYSPKLWKEMGELGWVGILFPEAYGGAELGMAELVLVLEALGTTLAPEPFLSTVLLGGRTIARYGSDEQKAKWLPQICEGDAIVTLATQEPRSRFDCLRVEARAERSADGFVLTGVKNQVLDAGAAAALLIPARTAGSGSDREGISLFLVESGASGLSIQAQSRLDYRAVGLVSLDAVAVGPEALVGAEGAGADVLEHAIEGATVGLCAEMLGGMSRAFEMTLDHMKEREQFGTVIGTFQALKHRAARLFMEIELSRGAVMAAARALDAQDGDAAKLVSLAKARCSEVYLLAANEAVQIFGGVGMTDEYDIGFYLKRARAAQLTFGDAAYHRERWAALSAY